MTHYIKYCEVASLFFTVICVCSSENRIFDSLTDKCKDNTKDTFSTCKKSSLAKWNSRDIIINDLKFSCCFTWDTRDCVESFVKTDYDNLKEEYFNLTKKLEDDECNTYQYYSTKCTISEDELINGTEAQKQQLITKINVPSDTCKNQLSRTNASDVCSENIAYEFRNSYQDLRSIKSLYKMVCCSKWQLIDCLIDEAKLLDQCSHQDINGMILIYDAVKANWSRILCYDFPYGSHQCQDNTAKQACLSINLALIFVFSLLLQANIF